MTFYDFDSEDDVLVLIRCFVPMPARILVTKAVSIYYSFVHFDRTSN